MQLMDVDKHNRCHFVVLAQTTAAAWLQPYSSKIGRSACSLAPAAGACVDNRWTHRYALKNLSNQCSCVVSGLKFTNVKKIIGDNAIFHISIYPSVLEIHAIKFCS